MTGVSAAHKAQNISRGIHVLFGIVFYLKVLSQLVQSLTTRAASRRRSLTESGPENDYIISKRQRTLHNTCATGLQVHRQQTREQIERV